MSASAARMLADRQEILDRISDLALGLDLPDPARYRRCFADTVEIRTPAFGPANQHLHRTGDEWSDSVGSTQARLRTRLHTLTSPSIDLRGDEAEVIVLQQALFADAVGTYRVAGPLRLGFACISGRWRVRALHFEVTWSEGDAGVYSRAREQAR
ncbi:MAG: nuclear transport factor 2 family protein [Pseudonocardiaceae bacterium]